MDAPLLWPSTVAGERSRARSKAAHVVGLLRDARARPIGGPGAAGIAAPIVGQNGEIIGKHGRDGAPLIGIAGATGVQKQRWSAAAHCVVQLDRPDIEQAGVLSRHRGPLPEAFPS